MAGKSDDKKGGGVKRIATIAVVVVGLVGGVKGFVLGGPPAAAGAAGPTTTTTEPHGPVVTLEPITLNIAGDRFLKVGLAFQLAHDYEPVGHGPDSDDPTKGYARAVDLVIDTLAGRTFEELVTPEGRSRAKEEIGHLLEEAYPDEIEGVYFTEFVMQ